MAAGRRGAHQFLCVPTAPAGTLWSVPSTSWAAHNSWNSSSREMRCPLLTSKGSCTCVKHTYASHTHIPRKQVNMYFLKKKNWDTVQKNTFTLITEVLVKFQIAVMIPIWSKPIWCSIPLSPEHATQFKTSWPKARSNVSFLEETTTVSPTL